MTTAASLQPIATSRMFVQEVMRRLASVKNQTVAIAIGKDESTVSRIASGEQGVRLPDMFAFLDALGLKAVDKRAECYDRRLWNAYRTIAAFAMPLDEDDPE